MVRVWAVVPLAIRVGLLLVVTTGATVATCTAVPLLTPEELTDAVSAPASRFVSFS